MSSRAIAPGWTGRLAVAVPGPSRKRKASSLRRRSCQPGFCNAWLAKLHTWRRNQHSTPSFGTGCTLDKRSGPSGSVAPGGNQQRRGPKRQARPVSQGSSISRPRSVRPVRCRRRIARSLSSSLRRSSITRRTGHSASNSPRSASAQLDREASKRRGSSGDAAGAPAMFHRSGQDGPPTSIVFPNGSTSPNSSNP